MNVDSKCSTSQLCPLRALARGEKWAKENETYGCQLFNARTMPQFCVHISGCPTTLSGIQSIRNDSLLFHFGTLLRDMEDAFVQTTVWTDFPRPFKAVARNWLGGKQISLTGWWGRGSSTRSDNFTLWRIPRMRKMGVLISRLRISFMRERPHSAL